MNNKCGIQTQEQRVPSAGSVPRRGCGAPFVSARDTQGQFVSLSTRSAFAESCTADALGRRAWTWDGAETNFFVYDGNHAVAETDATGGLRRAYTRAPGTDRWLSMTVYPATSNFLPITYYFLTDLQGTVHALADESGSVVESYAYDAWGRVLGVYGADGSPLAVSAVGNRILFQGREYDWATGFYYFRARWYDPVTGRWLSKDPIGLSGGLNQYAFCGDDPVNHRDPAGLEWFPSGPNVTPGTIWSGGISETIGNVWNAPNTVLGLGLGGAGMLFGGNVPNRNAGGSLEFQSNPVAGVFPIYAITLGNVINYAPGIRPTDLVPRYDQMGRQVLRTHEMMHIPQEQLWGPLFLPAYLLAELLPGINPFETAADNGASRIGRCK